jgi:hypothetical protein
MAAVPIQIDGILWDHATRKGTKVTLMGDAFISGLAPGGGPIVPPDTEPPEPPLGIWGPTDPRPTHPIVLPPTPPGVDPPHPAHPIVLPPVPPDPPIVPPDQGPPEGWSWHWTGQEWLLVYNPPADAAQPHA